MLCRDPWNGGNNILMHIVRSALPHMQLAPNNKGLGPGPALGPQLPCQTLMLVKLVQFPSWQTTWRAEIPRHMVDNSRAPRCSDGLDLPRSGSNLPLGAFTTVALDQMRARAFKNITKHNSAVGGLMRIP